MKNEKRVRVVLTVLMIVFMIGYVVLIGFKEVKKYFDWKEHQKVCEEIDKMERDYAIRVLKSREGRISEIESLSKEEIPQDILMDYLERWVSIGYEANTYLSDITLSIPNTSDMGEICEDLRKQIENHIEPMEICEEDDKMERAYAIRQLEWMDGKISAIGSLSKEEIPQDILMDDLERVVAVRYDDNTYLSDITLSIPNTSDIGEICENLREQIKSHIDTIEIWTWEEE